MPNFLNNMLGVIRVFDEAAGIFRDIFDEQDAPDCCDTCTPNYPLDGPPSAQPNYPLDNGSPGPPEPPIGQYESQLKEQQRRLEHERKRAEEWERRARAAEARAARPKPADPYTILGVTENAPDFIIKAAFKAAARRAHSDTGGTDAAMKRLNKAMDEIKRRRGWK